MSADWHTAGPWIVAHMAGALLLGWVFGYERYFSGRASGSQVYCLVCATSCAVTLVASYPSLWYWGTAHEVGGGDPTRVIGSALQGTGFLGAGIIVQTGVNVRGLTTAASIWGSSAIGILVGVGFYLPAIGLTARASRDFVCELLTHDASGRPPGCAQLSVLRRLRRHPTFARDVAAKRMSSAALGLTRRPNNLNRQTRSEQCRL